jgi:hypothetical protein
MCEANRWLANIDSRLAAYQNFNSHCFGEERGNVVSARLRWRLIDFTRAIPTTTGGSWRRRPARQNQNSSAARWRLFADLPPQDFDCGGSARHHHSFGVEAALVQDGAPVFEFAEDVDFAVRGADSGVVKLMHVGHAAE